MDQPKPPKIRKEEGTQINSFLLLRNENAKIHRTEAYHTSQVVLRRGFDFLAQFQLSDEFNPDEHSLEVHFRRGSRPAYSRETHFVSRIGGKPSRSYHWPGSTLKTNREVVTVAVKTPVDVPVGEYEVEAEISHEGASSKFVCQETVVFLFNPWHEDDEVYLEKEEARQEYVMNGMGLIWAGTYKNMFTWPWEYAQFESHVLNVALLLLDQKDLVSNERQTAAKVARTAAEMVNFNDDEGGILWGDWSGDYGDGTSPTSWSGSGAILEQYWRTREAVKYAQCWVFGGTLTSVLRSLGIPSRPITNFVSAHDTDANRAIDFYYDTKGVDLLEDISADSIWNYHVWTEAWMERPDLKGHYGGWQALDATPQEPSPHSDKYTLGPAPLSAIKDGLSLKYDCEFVISEVNADVKYHVRQKDGTFKDAGSDTRYVGKKISTKALDSEEREDITDRYKYAEGSLQERTALQAGADRDGSETSGLQVDIETASDVMIGSPMKAKVVVKSTAGDKRFVELTIKVNAVSYIGALGKQVYSKHGVETVAAGDVIEIPITVAPSDYIPALKDQFLLNITVFAQEEATDFSFLTRDTFRFKTPDLDIVIGDGSTSKVAVGNRADITATFTNLLPVPLTKVQWFVEGSGLTEPLKIVGSDISAGNEGEVQFSILPKDASLKYRTLVITCDSRELPAVMGKARVYIQ